mmetsp:Transcript_4108/g.15469  ORF Transcript_4108/g.15469 Transcript_4108/m.15469 type:complete len:1103 (-) Transcript_4108:1031-4339(-)|eukprot:CAMPEP_0117444234 /NCGR_PEP_ID=MMETSP0759-20121206/5128_1 /TAXON_ID=63605 /ORGANISM="Percolomonas cosmopolitus, Strain WS" /LENGTH=1102 /DNA_ID=CAMNT_0005236279 /DNA_START=238 /DNA_END=3546 /DNA_ORIENTATION=+
MGQSNSLTSRQQTHSDIHLFTSLSANGPSSQQQNVTLTDPGPKRTPTTLKSTRSSEYRIKDFKKPFQHKKKISVLYIDEGGGGSSINEGSAHSVGGEGSKTHHNAMEGMLGSDAASSVGHNGESSHNSVTDNGVHTTSSQSSNQRRLWTASADKSIICWNLSNGKPLTLFQGHTDTVTALKRKDSLLFSASFDRTIRIWDLNEKYQHCIDVIQDRENWLCALELWRNFVIVAGYARNINIYDLNSKQKARALHGHQKRIEALFVDDCILYSCSVDGTVRLWDLEQGGAALGVIQARDQCFALSLWNEKWLLVGQQEDIVCWNLEKFDLGGAGSSHVSAFFHHSAAATGNTTAGSLGFASSGGVLPPQMDSMITTTTTSSTHDSFTSSLNHQQHTSSPQQQTNFVGLSTYCTYDYLLIGWNRSKRRFEFWNLVNSVITPSRAQNSGESSGREMASCGHHHNNSTTKPTRQSLSHCHNISPVNPAPKLIHTIDTDILLCSALYFVPGVLFFVSGTRIGTVRVELDLKREEDRMRWFTRPEETPSPDEEESEETPTTPRSAEVQNNSQSSVHRGKSRTAKKRMQSPRTTAYTVQQPAYSLYTRLFHYFTETLLYPSTKVANAIEYLHQEGKLYSPDSTAQSQSSDENTNADDSDDEPQEFDTQVLLLGEYLRNTQHQIMSPTTETRSSTEQPSASQSKDPLNFSIYLNSKQESESSTPLPKMYTKDELALDFESRIALFYKKLQTVTTDVIQPTVIVVRREHLVFDAFKHFTQLSLNDLKKPLYVFFANERGLDSGGVSAEMYRLLSEEILNENNALFENHKNTYFPNPKSSVNETHLQYFKFIGRVIGKALSDMQLMRLHFSPVLFKYLIGKRVSFSDLQHVDRTMYLSLKKVLELDNVEELGMEFVAEVDDFGKSNTFHLLDTSSSEAMHVTSENKYKFVELLSRWILIESVRYQVELILEGIYEVIPKPYFQLFDEKEIELLLCGNPELDLNDWKEHTKLEGYEENDPAVDIFWQTVARMNHIERGKLLCFVTGTSNPPSMGFVNMNPNFCIAKLHGATRDYLPQAMTCVNRMSIPQGYPSVEWCYKKLMLAIEGGVDFAFA